MIVTNASRVRNDDDRPDGHSPLILLAAGGTGGHLFPAEALGVELIRRGLRVRLATDSRALRYSGLFSKDMIDVVPSETVRGRTPLVAGPYRRDARRRHRRGAQPDAPAEARGRGRLRRLSDVAAADGGAAVRRARHHSRSQRGARPRQPFSVEPRQRDRNVAARRARSRSGAGGKDHDRRHADASGDPRRRRRAVRVPGDRTGRCACWWSAAARARA